ncbi:MAG: hypothetical protein HY906_23880, partial [Deltaproteobacteria bacterium]|nr:hypothetical protein [Deltaproteobacteria bacterium]
GAWRALEGGWLVEDAVGKKRPEEAWGLTGTRAVGPPGASLLVGFDARAGTADDVARIQVSWLDAPDAGALEVAVDGEVVATPPPPPPGSPPRARVLELAAPGNQHEVTLTSVGDAPVAVFGVSHEVLRPGIVYDALGLPGATSMTLAGYAQQPLVDQLRAREVDLFVLFYGTNEASLPGEAVAAGLRPAYGKILTTLRLASPFASCLVLGPTDRMSRKKRGAPWRPAESGDVVATELEVLAQEYGCAYWSTRSAMGGAGAIDRWWRASPPLAHRDHVHLTRMGYQQLAERYVADLLDAYDAWRAAR